MDERPFAGVTPASGHLAWHWCPVDVIAPGDLVELRFGQRFEVGEVLDLGAGLVRLYPVGDRLPFYVANGRGIWRWS